jgi:hypothetical protein
MNGGGPRTGADYSEAPHFATPSFEQFFVIPIVEQGGKPTFGEWIEFASSQQAARAGRAASSDYRGWSWLPPNRSSRMTRISSSRSLSLATFPSSCSGCLRAFNSISEGLANVRTRLAAE